MEELAKGLTWIARGLGAAFDFLMSTGPVDPEVPERRRRRRRGGRKR
ncbi:hypothetical protein [Streptomyces sp. NPDC090025]